MTKYKLIKVLFIPLLLALSISMLMAQGKPYEGPDDEAGDVQAIREGYMTGNRILLYFQNTTELAKWTESYVGSAWSRWPNNYSGTRSLDGIALLIGARVYLENDSIPVTDPMIIQSRTDLDTLWFLQTSYREEMDTDPTGTIEWGLYPIFGYFNEIRDYPAMSNDSLSWPDIGWPATGRSLKWPGEWNGRFGRGVIYADLETYFVANDAQDQEYLGPEDRIRYYPRPGRKIGDIDPGKITIQRGKPWGGIGVRVSQRGFQWNNPQARDAIFWEYSIANISDYDLPEMAFGYWVDNGVGGESDDEIGYFDTYIDMAYSWDTDEKGAGGLRTGAMGFAYLESPGLPYDGIDNDQDGLLDEKRDNDAGDLIGATDGIYDLAKFLEAYRLDIEDLKPHYAGEEDQDWENGVDLNGNGTYAIEIGPGNWAVETGESAGDDVGVDGVGPTELNYRGPDDDGSEGNGRPDFSPIGCEPNFNTTDVTESDMIGLTSFRLFPIPQHRPPYTRWFRNDRSMFETIGVDSTLEYLGNISNLVECFASGTFPLYKGREERISMSELHAYDPLVGLNSATHTAPALFEAKRIVQVIYEKDYRFAQPPKMPTLIATPADGKAILTWDNISDTKTRDPFMGNINDFEGYKVFRATDKYMQDAEVITDGYGTPMGKKPIFQCDLIDNVKGFTSFGLVNGMGYNLGDDTGIVHHFVDNTVQNGRTYYYAIVAYDFGAPNIGPGIAPSENNAVIKLDEAEEVASIGQNVAIVVPHQMAAGYIPPTVQANENTDVLGSGTIVPEILATGGLKYGHTYKVAFTIDTLRRVQNYDHGIFYSNNGMKIYNANLGNALVYSETPAGFAFDNMVYNDTTKLWSFKIGQEFSTDVFDGLRLNIFMPVKTAQLDRTNSGWMTGTSSITVLPTVQETFNFPWDYDIIFTNIDSTYIGRVTTKTMRDEKNLRISSAQLLVAQAFNFYVINKNFLDSTGAYEKLDLVVQDMNNNLKYDMLVDRILVGPVTTNNRWAGTAFIINFQQVADSSGLPQANDAYHLTFRRPFWTTDTLSFTVNQSGELDRRALQSSLDNIKVVPNPYIMTNAMETAVASQYFNQRRRIMFTHVPAECSIKIFTSSGILIDEIVVKNQDDNGSAFWDLLTQEGLEIAAGVYIYHLKATQTGDQKMGKFAIVK